jgi:hypothetical protein
LDFVTRFGGQLMVVNANELAGFRELVFVFLKARRQLDERPEAAMFTSQLGALPSVLHRLRIRERRLDLARSFEPFGQSIAEAQLSFLSYFWRNRSTRPAVSISFCLPVKNGWHWLQMSVWISA